MFSIEMRLHALARRSKHALFSLSEARSWRLCSPSSLAVTLHRMVKKGLLVRLWRGLYYAPSVEQPAAPVDDLLYAAQKMFGGYLAFATALYLHRLRDEFPFTVFVATFSTSTSRSMGVAEVKAVALRERAVGVQQMGDYVVSSRAKTLFDCLYLPSFGGGEPAMISVFKKARLSKSEWKEFFGYVRSFEKKSKKFHRRLERVLRLAGMRGVLDAFA